MSEDHSHDVLNPLAAGESDPAAEIEPGQPVEELPQAGPFSSAQAAPPGASEPQGAVEPADPADPPADPFFANDAITAPSSPAESSPAEPGRGGRSPKRRALTAPQRQQRRAAARRSTGPRSAPGKSHSRMNASTHGLSAHATFFWESMVALGEDPEDFKQLFAGLIESLHPAGTVEMALTGDLAVLMWKKARLERAQHGVWDRHQELLELEHRRAAADLDYTSVDTTHEAILATGLRGVPDSIAKFEETLSVLELLSTQAKQKNYQDDVAHFLRLLYGEHLTWRGGQIEGFFGALQQAAKRGVWDEAQDSAQRALKLALNEEVRDVTERYQVFFKEKVEVTRAQRNAALAPEGPQWVLMIRMENSLHRHIERRLRLLLEMQRQRRQWEEPEDPSPRRTPLGKTSPRRAPHGSPPGGPSPGSFDLGHAITGSNGVNFGFSVAALKGASTFSCHARASFSRVDFHSPSAPIPQPVSAVIPAQLVPAQAGIHAGSILATCLPRHHAQKMFFNKTNRRSYSKQSIGSVSFCRKSSNSESLGGSSMPAIKGLELRPSPQWRASSRGPRRQPWEKRRAQTSKPRQGRHTREQRRP